MVSELIIEAPINTAKLFASIKVTLVFFGFMTSWIL